MIRRRLAPALGLMLASLGSLALGFANWRAETYAHRDDFARAIAWRPDNGPDLRVLGEQMLATHAKRALPLLIRSVRMNPESALTRMDLVTAELATGQLARAQATAARSARHFPYSFRLHWLWANLALTAGKRESFWRQFHRSCQLADDSYFRPMIMRAMTIPRPSSRRVWAELPPQSLAAAAGFLRIALSLQRTRQLPLALVRVLQLSRHLDPRQRDRARTALLAVLQRDLSADPVEALMIWNRGLRLGVFQGRPKYARGELVTAPDFPASSLQRYTGANTDWLGWFPLGNTATEFNLENHRGGRLVIDLSGMEGSQTVELLRQWLLTAPGTALKLSMESRCRSRRDPGECGGFSLQLRHHQKTLFRLPAPAAADWQRASATFVLPPAPAAVKPLARKIQQRLSPSLMAYQLRLTYQRPFGATPLDGSLRVRRISVETLPAAPTPPGRPSARTARPRP